MVELNPSFHRAMGSHFKVIAKMSWSKTANTKFGIERPIIADKEASASRKLF
ncbi:hypothetical protein D3C76_1589260 [compost metagenome]